MDKILKSVIGQREGFVRGYSYRRDVLLGSSPRHEVLPPKLKRTGPPAKTKEGLDLRR